MKHDLDKLDREDREGYRWAKAWWVDQRLSVWRLLARPPRLLWRLVRIDESPLGAAKGLFYIMGTLLFLGIGHSWREARLQDALVAKTVVRETADRVTAQHLQEGWGEVWWP